MTGWSLIACGALCGAVMLWVFRRATDLAAVRAAGKRMLAHLTEFRLFFDEPRLIFKDRVDIGHDVMFVVNKEIVIEEDVNVASGVRFMDTDAHPRDVLERIADLPPRPEEIKPVRICRHAWIGQNSFILKGVTVGEGAVVGVGSVVLADVPPYAVVMGNPARVVVKGTPPAAPASPVR